MPTTRRPDLAHLTPEALTQLANVGLVKRALREREAGYVPELRLEDDDTLVASFSDGVVTRWPKGKPIQQSQCSCPAPGLCRHRLIAALQWRAQASVDPEEDNKTIAICASHESAKAEKHPENSATPPSPGTATDDDLATLLPPAVLARARQQRDAGLAVQVHRRTAGEPCDTARLPAATVRYWAGAHLGAARCDCVQQTACEHVALGVWAFRAADAQNAQAARIHVQLGAPASAIQLDAAPYLAVVAALLRHGVASGNAAIAPALSNALQHARAAGAEWLLHTLADLEQWSAAYAARSARYTPETGADLVAEIALRLTLGSAPGQAKAVLGIGQSHEVPLDRLRLMCLGARTERDGDARRTLLVMADADTGTRMALVHHWQVPRDRRADEATLRAAERLAPGVRLQQLASGQLLSQQARRFADGRVALARTRSNQNSLLPQSGDWAALTPPLRYTSAAALRQARAEQPHPLAAPRHAAGRFVVFSPARIAHAAYDPHTQTVQCLALDAGDDAVLIRRSHAAHVPHALHALALALAEGTPAHIGGRLHWQGDLPVIEPWSVASQGADGSHRLHVLDFTTPSAAATEALTRLPLGHAEGDASNHPLPQALAAVRALCGALLHHGSAALPRQWHTDASHCATRLEHLGFAALAQHTRALAQAPRATALAALLALRQLHEDVDTAPP
ncbi:MAG: hypothetical protein Q4G71_02805 [Pseudomonadota bacterium]|nr:hypothetical protein [Pseudomonadota bacterium]